MKSKWQKVQAILDQYKLRSRLGDEVCIQPQAGSKSLEIIYKRDSTPEEVLHEVAHYILISEGTSPWLLVPPWVRKGWRDGTLKGDWLAVAEAADEKDHEILEPVLKRLIRRLG